MAKRSQFTELTKEERMNRYFSEDLKRKIVSELERKLVTKAEICREYQVSRTAVDKWVYKYSPMKKKKERLVYESDSDTRKIAALKMEIAELKQMVGDKQIKIEFLEKMIELTEEDLGIKFKKKENK